MDSNQSKNNEEANVSAENLKAMNLELENIVQERTESLLKMNKDLELANRELDAFIYRASHDFRAPIASINGLINIARMEVQDESALGFLEEIGKVVNKTDNMLRKLLMVNLINRYSAERVLERVDFEAILYNLKEAFAGQMNEVGMTLELDIAPNLHYLAEADLIQIIFYNMIENSIAFRSNRPNESPWLKISVVQVAEDNCVQITLSDNGLGIPNKYFRKIFRMFFRGNETATQGNGLGLYVVKKAVQKLKGRINVESEEEQYTTFNIYLPYLSANS
jgi:light-regulated signal transduction histidine kinase (bacteriophytochrome)